MRTPRVHVSVLGRFHAFDLARELARADALAHLVTTYPRFAAARFGVPRHLVSSVLTTELLRRSWPHLPGVVTGGRSAQRLLCEHFERRAARRVTPDADVFVGWSGCSLAAIERAKELGLTTVVERGSLHMLTQQQLVREEYEEYGLEPALADPAIVEKELAEYEAADYIAVPSLCARDSFLERGVPAEKLLHIPYGVALEQFQPPREPRRDNVFRIIQVGGVNLRKGCQFLIEAFRSLDLPDAELLFVGSVAPEMRAWQARHASERIVFHGPVPQHELPALYGRSDVSCLASIQEGFGMVIPQAMACGLPVITTVNTGGRDIIHDGVDGYLVPIRDSDALAERLLRLYRNRRMARAMGEAARERVEAGFGWEDYGARALGAYRRCHAARTGQVQPGAPSGREQVA